MYFYLLFIVILYVGGCNARVVPLDFKVDKSKNVDSSGNELIDESPMNEGEILGHKLPDIGQSKDLEPLNSKEDSTPIPEISNRNTSQMPADLTPKEKAMGEESNLESAESLEKSDLLEEKLNSTSEFISQNSSNSREAFETIHVNGTLNKTEDLTFKNESSISNSSLDFSQRNSLDLRKIEKVLNDTLSQNETFEVMRSDQNETSAISENNNGNTSANFFELQPLTNDTKLEVPSDAENITEKFKSNNLTSENLELTNDSVNDAGGILSGFDFLINSEVARNAAKAMEVFNFSDPLTDHIMEENEFHSFLAVQELDSPNQTDLQTTIITNGSGESNEIRADFNVSLPSGDETSIELNQTVLEEIKKDSSMRFNLSEPLEKGNETELFDLKEKLEGNLTSEASSPLKDSEEKNTVSKKNITVSVSNSITAGVPECPPAGWCIFWFLSQDACAVNEHCHGNRICCKIGCSKTCIEIESLG